MPFLSPFLQRPSCLRIQEPTAISTFLLMSYLLSSRVSSSYRRLLSPLIILSILVCLSSELSSKTFGFQGPTMATLVLLIGSSRSFFSLPANIFRSSLFMIIPNAILVSSCSVQALSQKVRHPRSDCHRRFSSHRRPFLRQHKRARFHPAAPNLRPNPGFTRRALSRRGGFWSSDDDMAGV
jgi:hypothetical protein